MLNTMNKDKIHCQ